MSSACNVPKLVRCRVRDFASCFYSCRLPLDEENDNISGKQSRTPSREPTIYGSKGTGQVHEGREKMSVRNGGKMVRNLSRDVRGGGRVRESGDGSSEPRFAEEDYIVFCFREDGKIDMINEGQNNNHNNNNNSNNNNNNNKYNSSEAYDGDEGAEKIITAASTLRPLISRKKGDEKGSNEKRSDDEVKEINSTTDQQSNNSTKMDSFESCDSNLSDTSTSSFAFPVLGLDWIGSPVHMPKSEKPEDCSLRLHCCKF